MENEMNDEVENANENATELEEQGLNLRIDELKNGLNEENKKYRDAVMKNLLMKHSIAEDKLVYLHRLIDSGNIDTVGFEEAADKLIKEIVLDLPSLLKSVEGIGINPASKLKQTDDLRTIVSRKLKKNKK